MTMHHTFEQIKHSTGYMQSPVTTNCVQPHGILKIGEPRFPSLGSVLTPQVMPIEGTVKMRAKTKPISKTDRMGVPFSRHGPTPLESWHRGGPNVVNSPEMEPSC